MPQPVLSVLYILALRLGVLRPSFVPLAVLTLFPLASLVLGVRARRTQAVLLVFAVLEVIGAVIGEAIVGFAVAWQSG